MPADRLTQTATDDTERAIWHTLAGAETLIAGMDPGDLAQAAQIYRTAGRAALTRHLRTDWRQYYIRFADWDRAEHDAATHLLPVLHAAEHDGTIANWWFMRKHPCWRLRLLPALPGGEAAWAIEADLDTLVAAGRIDAWWPGLYEAETAAFGGGPAMDAAHTLFAADSRGVLDLAASAGAGLGRRELSILLCSALMRGTALEWYERGDVWDRVAAERHLPADVPADRIETLGASIRTLLLADTSPQGPQFGPDGPVAAQSPWAQAFTAAGRALADANRNGELRRGLRDILSYHVIFHWNRLGLPARTQAVLAHAARTTILGPATPAPPARPVRRAGDPSAFDPDRAVQRFPLIHQGQGRPFCDDLAARVARVGQMAEQGAHQADPELRVNDACYSWNLAALIAADCGLPDLAEQLCLQQFQIIHRHWPVTGRTAIASLQPLVNLARLAERAGDPERAYTILDQLHTAAHTAGTVTVAGQRISFEHFITSGGDHAPVQAWLRRVLREDGTRALVTAGAWSDAAEHAAAYDDQPEQLRESRQIRVIAAARDHRASEAQKLIDTADAATTWDRAVAACLHAYVHAKAAQPDADANAAMLTHIQAVRALTDPVTVVARIRLGLAAAHLGAATHPRDAKILHAELAHDAQHSGNAYAASEVLLNNQAATTFPSPPNRPALHSLTDAAGLGQGSMPDDMKARLSAATAQAGEVLKQTLKHLTATGYAVPATSSP